MIALITECCEVCGASNADTELFGYRCAPGSRIPFPEGWRWFCAEHRLGQWYADKRLPAVTYREDNNGQVADED
jgi:hypothetical protein